MSLNRREFVAATLMTLTGVALDAAGQSRPTPSPEASTNRPADAPPSQRRRGGPHKAFDLPPDLSQFASLSLILGRATDSSITLSAASTTATDAFYEFGADPLHLSQRTPPFTLTPGEPTETLLPKLTPNTRYHYRLLTRPPGNNPFTSARQGQFHTQRSPGSSFTFAIQGDSHPERASVSDPALYARTLQLAAASNPDFHICMGDDFSIDTLHTLDQPSITSRYALQRPFLSLISHSAPIHLLNGNHEQASLYNYNLPGEPHDAAVFAQLARNKLFPTPTTSPFYPGNTHALPGIGALNDYYAWTWGDALFVILDNYWHSPALVDNPLHESPPSSPPQNGDDKRKKGKSRSDPWLITLGDEQYHWLQRTLESSRAKWKFVFAHHVLGTGRGGVERANLHEWGGQSPRGDNDFPRYRPTWALPIHQLMARHNVTLFFQGHDHLYAHQQLDGITYQTVPMPSDFTYSADNAQHYTSGTRLPNSGFLHVQVSPDSVTVEYRRSFLPRDESPRQQHGSLAHSYTLRSPKSASP